MKSISKNNIGYYPQKKKSKVIHEYAFYVAKLKLGCEFFIPHGKIYHRCKFIKVTRKGFNFLNVETNKCLLNKHLYSPGMARKDFHEDLQDVKIRIPHSLTLYY